MTILKILTVPDPRLKIKAKPVKAVDAEVRQLMDDMVETMYADNGIGLAATQLGIDKRVIVIDVPIGMSTKREEEEKEYPSVLLKMVNPEILWKSEEASSCNEGCLSVPEQRVIIERPARVKVRFLDENNKVQELDMEQLQAACVQHEIDHLNGKLIIDYLPTVKRDIMVRKVKRLQNC